MINNPILGDELQSLSGIEFIAFLLNVFISLGFAVAAIYFIFNFIKGAIAWISSGADPSMLANAKLSLARSISGLLLVLFSFAVVNFVGCLFGINFLSIRVGEFNVGFGSNPICPSSSVTPPPPPPGPTPTSSPQVTLPPPPLPTTPPGCLTNLSGQIFWFDGIVWRSDYPLGGPVPWVQAVNEITGTVYPPKRASDGTPPGESGRYYCIFVPEILGVTYKVTACLDSAGTDQWGTATGFQPPTLDAHALLTETGACPFTIPTNP